MKYRMLDLLRCPECGECLCLFIFEEKHEEFSEVYREIKSPHCRTFCGLKQIDFKDWILRKELQNFDCPICYQKEIIEGLLICGCGSLFPIVGSVPRFIDSKLNSFPEFIRKYKKKIETVAGVRLERGITKNAIMSDEFQSIRTSFSVEWNMFDYSKDRAWGWDLNARKKVVLSDFNLEKSLLKGKLLLDAGCGNGALTAALVGYEMEVIGLDISESVAYAELNKSKIAKERSGFVHFVQGNLNRSPLAKNSVDLIYCYGVIHHTPNPQESFSELVPLLKKGGRIYIWVYGKRGLPVRLFSWHGRWLRKHVSLKFLSNYCRILSPLYKFITDILSTLRIYPFRKRTIREIALDLFDNFSPQYNHTFTSSEVCKWFSERGLTNICVSGVQKQGFGVYGDKI